MLSSSRAASLLKPSSRSAKPTIIFTQRSIHFTPHNHATATTANNVSGNEEPIDLVKLDEKWSSKWRAISPNENSIYPLPKSQPTSYSKSKKKYIMSQFPYPSGILHMGHLRVYTISDVLSRYNRSQGHEVIHPMGWDAFGLPAENAAIERGIDPSIWTHENIKKMKEQMKLMMVDFDWDREVTTCDADYYKWTQKIFLLLYEEGLAYRKEAEINWDPVDLTVLANEQVDAEGRSWRSGAIVEKKMLRQWFLGITQFAKELNKDLSLLEEWPNKVKLMQKHWIGESQGTEVTFGSTGAQERQFKVYTTRVDTLYSVQYLALAVDNEYVLKLAEENQDLKQFISRASTLPEGSKEGFELTGVKAVNPVSLEEVPIFVAPYVLGSYGSGAVMGCPGHDERDYEFWLLNKPNRPIVKSVEPATKKSIEQEETHFEGPFTEHGILNDSAKEFQGLTTAEAKDQITNKLATLGAGHKTTQFRIRDWLISRQRYWGAPIPIIHCPSCGEVPVPEADLPVLLPENVEFTGKKGNPLENLSSFNEVECPSCGGHAKRDTDTMDTFMDSSWYFFRYTDPKNLTTPFDFKKATEAMPVDIYVGGVEHAILHLLYSRFLAKFLAKKGLWDGSKTNGEPFKKLVTQGMVHGKTYSDPANGRFLKPDELDLSSSGSASEPTIKSSGASPVITYEKMSKSKYNGADPTECITTHGSDATRAHILFQAPINDILDWDESKIVGIERWLRRVLQFSKSSAAAGSTESTKVKPIEQFNEDEIKFHNESELILRNITQSFETTLSLNTVISDYMKLFNLISSATATSISPELIHTNFKKMLIVMSPITPVTAEEAWESVHLNSGIWETIFAEKWPTPEPIIQSHVTKYNIFVNGKMRFTFEGDVELYNQDQGLVRDTILNSKVEGVEKWLGGKKIRKVITKKNAISFVIEK